MDKVRLTRRLQFYVLLFVYDGDRLTGVKEPGHPVVYLRGWPFSSAEWLAEELKDEIRMSEIAPEDIFVLVPSIKQGNSSDPTPVNILENALVEAGIPCFSSMSKDEPLNDKAIAGKVPSAVLLVCLCAALVI